MQAVLWENRQVERPSFRYVVWQASCGWETVRQRERERIGNPLTGLLKWSRGVAWKALEAGLVFLIWREALSSEEPVGGASGTGVMDEVWSWLCLHHKGKNTCWHYLFIFVWIQTEKKRPRQQRKDVWQCIRVSYYEKPPSYIFFVNMIWAGWCEHSVWTEHGRQRHGQRCFSLSALVSHPHRKNKRTDEMGGGRRGRLMFEEEAKWQKKDRDRAASQLWRE